MDFLRLEKIAADFMKDRQCHEFRETGDVFYHGQRVAKGVIQLRKMVTQDETHDDILKCAAMFHDIAKGMKPHSRYGAVLVREILSDELISYELDEVCRLIEAHGDRRDAREVHDVWVWLIQDADVLDHAGTQGIWLSTSNSVRRNKPISDLIEWYEKKFDGKIEKYMSRLNLDVSKAILRSKAEFERQFARRLKTETTGEYCPEDIL